MSPLRQRVHDLRRRLVAASVALFIALFGGIAIQLASGHDPALRSDKAATAPAGTSTSTSTSTSTTAATGASSGQTTVAPVTTSQS
jgi:hypothetical protein